jgi:hypothetical protein
MSPYLTPTLCGEHSSSKKRTRYQSLIKRKRKFTPCFDLLNPALPAMMTPTLCIVRYKQATSYRIFSVFVCPLLVSAATQENFWSCSRSKKKLNLFNVIATMNAGQT